MKVSNSNTFRKIVLYGLFCVLFCGIMSVDEAFGDGGEGHGADEGQVHTVTCKTAIHTRNIEQCSANYGGASWHIFKTSNGVYVGNLNNAKISPLSSVGVTYDTTHVDPLKGGGYDGKLASKCPASKYEYYMAYVYDGWNGAGLKGGPLFFGPVEWNVICPKKEGGGCNHPVYHTQNAHTYNNIISSINGGTNVNAWRISGSRPRSKDDSTYKSSEALKFYQDYNPGAKKIPDIGYFCVSKKSYNGFQGKSGVGDKSIGYTYTSGTAATYFMNNCTNGCKATFTHKVKRVKGRVKTSYTVARTSNLTDKNADHYITSGSLKTGKSGNNSGETVYKETLTLYPGMKVCETLTFEPYVDGDTATTKVCASALGEAQPNLSGDDAFINIKVKNNKVDKYKEYMSEVYAKPSDEVTYASTYNPKLQYTYYLKPEQMQIGSNGTVYNGGGSTLGALFNAHKSPGWKNAYSVNSKNFTMADLSYSFTKGSTAKRSPNPNSHTVQMVDVGKSLNEVARLNYLDDTKNTPNQVTFTKSGELNKGRVDIDSPSKKASAKVPYNYINSTKITSDNEKEVMYAGETFTVKYNYNIGTKKNSLTMNSGDKDYATSVGNPKWHLKVSVNGGAWTETSVISKRNSDFDVPINKLYTGKVGDDAVKLETSINVPDVPAGTNVCVKSVIFPATSGADNNLNGDGDGRWAESAEKCFKVAKKPSLQVWGGNTYTGGKINTAVSEKGSVAGVTGYAVEGKIDKKYIFGSWDELGVITNAVVTGFTSGASMGYPLGSNVPKFCDRIPLTFANSPCSDNATSSLGTSVAVNNASGDKESVIDKLMTEEVYKYSLNDLVLDEPITAGEGEVKVIYAIEDVTINQNITYVGNYASLNRVPKVVVYGKNIVIGCGVTRIDALLIANEKIVTCNNIDNELGNGTEQKATDHINERVNSNQLTIKGAVITNKLIANRTYGAAVGADSVMPAEIIDFDPTLYLWGNVGDGGNRETNRLEVTYLHELAPRR